MVTITSNMETECRSRAARPGARIKHMPERIAEHWRPLLASADAAVVVFISLITLNGGSGSRIAAAIATAGVMCGTFWLCGYYRESYAVVSRDEIYYACAGVALAAAPIAIVLWAIANFQAIAILLTLLGCALATSVVRVRLHLERRAHRPQPYPALNYVSPGAWHDREQPLFLASKRGFDLAVALLALVLFSPVMCAAALAIAIESPGPIFFRQERVGKDGVPFNIFKFRTMRPDAGPEWARPGDSRITRVGALLRRTSMDEPAALFNVLRSEMSVVGPRPEMVSFARDFSAKMRTYSQRHIVRPGITGWAQVYLKRNLQPDEMPSVLPYDLFYVEHSSILLDTALLLKTASEVLFHRAV